GGDSGPAIVSGDHAKSLFFKLVDHQIAPEMPYETAKLPDAHIKAIAEWIDLGAPYDKPLRDAGGSVASWTERVIDPAVRKHWAFQPLFEVAPPHSPPSETPAGDASHPIDAFLTQKLDQAGIAPNPRADRATLLRRATFDLWGLPPTIEELDAFVNDSSPDAWPKAIDRLLASPHYGERWARHWLDVARFAESHGFEHDYDRPTAYPYRDFVIKALNADLPYDQFLSWQIAGDELAPNDNLAMQATGFLAAGVHSTQITANEVEKHRYDELDDIVGTIGTSMLGLTIGCARCHDHKFDPIPQADYYRILSTFTTVVRSEVELSVDVEGDKQRREKYEKEHAPFVAELENFEFEELPKRFAENEAKLAAQLTNLGWFTAEPRELKSSGGASFNKQGDGSYIVEGANVDHDVYTFTVDLDAGRLTALRLEALADASLKKSGPGRADNGNFALTNLTVEIAPAKQADGTLSTAKRLELKNPQATFEQRGLPVAAVIDADAGSGWAVDPQFGKNHAAVFEFAEPIGEHGPTTLIITLHFNNNVRHSIGRPRLSFTNAPAPILDAPGAPAAVAKAIRLTADERTPDQRAALLDWYKSTDPDWQKLAAAERAHAATAPQPTLMKTLVASEGLPAIRLHTQGGDFFEETYYCRRGDVAQKEGVAPPGVLQVLSPEESHGSISEWKIERPEGSRTSRRRASFAAWLTDVNRGAGALAARVMVNRLWKHHFGRGLVDTSSDFGSRGEPPTHPELLDWLAQDLIAGGWRLKRLHKLMLTSAAYQETADFDASKAAVDQNNRLLWRWNRRRLEAEVVRDAVLAVSGRLDPTMYGPGTLEEASRRRSIYFTVKRSRLMSMMTVFDAPDGLSGVGDRATTTVAPQALFLLNNPHVRESMQAFAQRLLPEPATTWPDSVRTAYRAALGRAPSDDELTSAAAFLDAQTASHQAAGRDAPRRRAMADFCQVLVCLNEFIYVD
ncbi:MAG TPA: DUF1549 and DUF1553 domain-containing protein, partial [Pirellulales bacterium]